MKTSYDVYEPRDRNNGLSILPLVGHSRTGMKIIINLCVPLSHPLVMKDLASEAHFKVQVEQSLMIEGGSF